MKMFVQNINDTFWFDTLNEDYVKNNNLYY